LNQPNLAIDYCTRSIEIDDDNWHAWSNRSYAYWLKDQYDRAGEDLERAMSIDESARQLFQIRGMLNEAGLRPRIEMEDRQ
jgi:tetratricopeptide (TPR) repeat protein